MDNKTAKEQLLEREKLFDDYKIIFAFQYPGTPLKGFVNASNFKNHASSIANGDGERMVLVMKIAGLFKLSFSDTISMLSKYHSPDGDIRSQDDLYKAILDFLREWSNMTPVEQIEKARTEGWSKNYRSKEEPKLVTEIRLEVCYYNQEEVDSFINSIKTLNDNNEFELALLPVIAELGTTENYELDELPTIYGKGSKIPID